MHGAVGSWKQGQDRIESSGSTLQTETFPLKFPFVEKPRSLEQTAKGLLEQLPVLQVKAAAAYVLTGWGWGRGGDLMSPAP